MDQNEHDLIKIIIFFIQSDQYEWPSLLLHSRTYSSSLLIRFRDTLLKEWGTEEKASKRNAIFLNYFLIMLRSTVEDC